MLDSIDSDDEDEVDNLINDSGIEFVSSEPLVSGPSSFNSEQSMLALEASIHVIKFENTPNRGKQSSAEEKAGIKKTDDPC